MGTDKGIEREKHWVSHMERGNGGPWEKQLGIDMVRARGNPQGSREERGMTILWGKGEVLWEKQLWRGEKRRN